MEDGRTIGPGVQGGRGNEGPRRIEDVSDEKESENNRLYREKMEDEYAKREGGA